MAKIYTMYCKCGYTTRMTRAELIAKHEATYRFWYINCSVCGRFPVRNIENVPTPTGKPSS